MRKGALLRSSTGDKQLRHLRDVFTAFGLTLFMTITSCGGGSSPCPSPLPSARRNLRLADGRFSGEQGSLSSGLDSVSSSEAMEKLVSGMRAEGESTETPDQRADYLVGQMTLDEKIQ